MHNYSKIKTAIPYPTPALLGLKSEKRDTLGVGYFLLIADKVVIGGLFYA
jgi:hypothetical protein